MRKRTLTPLSLITRFLFVVYLGLFCVAAILLAFVVTVAALRITPNQLQWPASSSFMALFIGLAFALVPAMSFVGYGFAVFVLHWFSAERVLDFLDLPDEGAGPLSRISRWVHRTAAQLGVPSDI